MFSSNLTPEMETVKEHLESELGKQNNEGVVGMKQTRLETGIEPPTLDSTFQQYLTKVCIY